MALFRNYNSYKEEIELALIQNACVEIELYSIVASIIRESNNPRKLSVRDVSNRRKSNLSRKFYGAGGFPDFVVVERNRTPNPVQYGCIEVKMPTVPLEKFLDQVLEHLQSFRKVLYTNGIRWIYYEETLETSCFDITLGTIHGDHIAWEPEDTWMQLLAEIDTISWY